MKAAVIPCRNDNYGDNLHHRARLCLDNLLSVFDRVYYVDWKCVNGQSLLEAMNYKHERLHEFKITKELIQQHYPNLVHYGFIEPIARNVGIRKCIEDGVEWICATNIDILMDKFSTDILNKDTMYTVRKHCVPEHIHLDSRFIPQILPSWAPHFQRVPFALVNGKDVWDPGDFWSLIVAPGDFQLAHSSLWEEMKGFEEEAFGRSYGDSNAMKKPVLLGKKTEVLEMNIYHLEHTSNAYRESDEIKLPTNDRLKYVNNFTRTTNTEKWGMKGLV